MLVSLLKFLWTGLTEFIISIMSLFSSTFKFAQSWQSRPSLGCLLLLKMTLPRPELNCFGNVGYICWWNSVQPWWNWASAILLLVHYPFLASCWVTLRMLCIRNYLLIVNMSYLFSQHFFISPGQERGQQDDCAESCTAKVRSDISETGILWL